MTFTRRNLLATGLAVAPSLLLPSRFAFGAEPLKISHQFPGGSETEGDFRHRLCVRLAKELDIRCVVSVTADAYMSVWRMPRTP